MPPEPRVRPHTAAIRELDGIPFEVLVLRVQGGESDVAYLDDGNLERGVPVAELSTSRETGPCEWTADHERHWSAALQKLEAELAEANSTAASRPTTANMLWDQGRYVAEDGAVIYSAVGASEVAVAPAAPAAPMAVSSPCEPSMASVPAVESQLEAEANSEAQEFWEAPPSGEPMTVVHPGMAGQEVPFAACGTGIRGIRSLRQNRHQAPITA
mmetsp:Transcript_15054/g.33137  ORF Transcript_15054/g.33137 Transcript_15054/m.33137 type:complete len:214 (+) Transcript_15054:63-704(+)